MAHTIRTKRFFIKHQSLEVKRQLCNNRIKALERDILKKQQLVSELKIYISKYLFFL